MESAPSPPSMSVDVRAGTAVGAMWVHDDPATAATHLRVGTSRGGDAAGRPTSYVTLDSANNVAGVAALSAATLSAATLVAARCAFEIPHPTRPSTTLAHGAVHAPRCDLIYRGTKRLVAGRAAVDIDAECTRALACAMTPGTFAALCADDAAVFLQNTDGFDRVRGRVAGATLTIECERATCEDAISWMVVAERKDAAVQSWDRAASGRLVTERYVI